MKKQLLSAIFLLFIGLHLSYAEEKKDFFAAYNVSDTVDQCLPPTNPFVSEVTISSAKLSWEKATPTDSAWEILLIPQNSQTSPEDFPADNPILENGTIIIPVSGFVAAAVISNLNVATNYAYYIRTVCSETDKSAWSSVSLFNTGICETADTCIYRFLLTNTTNNNWNGGRIQVRQNGIVVATLGTGAINNPNGISVALCNTIPFDLYWSIEGTYAMGIGLKIQSPFTDIIYTKAPGEGAPLSVIYSNNSLANCLPPSCPKPTELQVSTITATSAQLSWTEMGSGSQWEVFVTDNEELKPENGTPLNSDDPSYYLVNAVPSLTLNELSESTRYLYYVRAICSTLDIGTWTLLSPISFITKPVNDECATAISITVSPTVALGDIVTGNTYGGTASTEISSCPGSENDDVWFSFVPTHTYHVVNFFNLLGTTTNLRFAIYQGVECGAMTQIFCNATNQYIAVLNNLTIGDTYKIRVFTNGLNTSLSVMFNLGITTPTPVSNDECEDAIVVAVNNNSSLSNSTTYGNVFGATASLGYDNSCFGAENDDVWFKFTATSNKHIINVAKANNLASNLNYGVYSGNCESLSLLSCSLATFPTLVVDNFVMGQTYYVRVWSDGSSFENIPFGISIKEVSTCLTAEPFCGSSVDDPYIFKNTTGLPSSSGIACLVTAPNPTFYTLKVSGSGPLVYNMLQNTAFNAQGIPTGNLLDVDFVAWGPFDSPDSCAQIAMTYCSNCPDNTTNANFYPLGNIVDCSYSASPTETLSIPSAIAGQYYVILITNYSGQPGFIKLVQTNSADANAGQTTCGDKIQMVAFVDANSNGIKDVNETNFANGSFTYQKNNTGTVNYLSNPYGVQSFYDENPASTYDFDYEINSEYAAYYAETPTNFNDLSITVGSGTQTLYFPITVTQTYTDVDVSIVSQIPPRPGFAYTHKIVYRNLGSLPTSGSITYTKSSGAAQFVEILPAATTTTVNSFIYNYTNLLPGEIRFINVKMMVPTIPTVSLGDVLSSTVAITSVENDINVNNNIFIKNETVVGSYDPNDKNEARGSTIEINQFDQEDYLFYTIRFQNTGTASADTVRIEDVLASQFDFASVRMISASHNYSMERINNKLIWNFNSINLPGAFQNELLSQGYVTFKVKLNPGFEVGDVIENTAQIFFDLNPAIITNTFQTTFVPNLGVGSFDVNNLIIYPNPAKEIVNIQLKNSAESLQKVTIYDMIGKTILSLSANGTQQFSVNVGSLSTGIYMIEITTNSNLKQTRRFIIK